MLNVRHIFRLCKQSAQCNLARPPVYFSSNADDSNSKKPPKKAEGEDNLLGDLLNTTYSRKNVVKGSKISPAKHVSKKALKSEAPSLKKAASEFVEPKSKGYTGVPLEALLKSSYNDTRAAKRNAESQQKSSAETDSPDTQPIDLSIKKKTSKISSSDLLDRAKKIAGEVSRPAGSKANEVATDLVQKLESLTKTAEMSMDLNELSFEADSKDGSNQSLDLLRNKVVSEEEVYRITPGHRGPRTDHGDSTPRWQGRQSFKEFSDSGERGPYVRSFNNIEATLYPKANIGIFNPESKEYVRVQSCLETFEKLEQREINLSNSFAPRNWFEQCIQWTDQGKLWHFPINNEQGLEAQSAVSFTEHVFLEDHLEGWCPTFGPIRHFMELVCLGLSKNPYLSVEEKIDCIMWYRDYFDKHKELLEAAGTMNSGVTKVPALEAQ